MNVSRKKQAFLLGFVVSMAAMLNVTSIAAAQVIQTQVGNHPDFLWDPQTLIRLVNLILAILGLPPLGR